MNVSEWRNALLCAVLLMTMLDEELLGVVLLALLADNVPSQLFRVSYAGIPLVSEVRDIHDFSEDKLRLLCRCTHDELARISHVLLPHIIRTELGNTTTPELGLAMVLARLARDQNLVLLARTVFGTSHGRFTDITLHVMNYIANQHGHVLDIRRLAHRFALYAEAIELKAEEIIERKELTCVGREEEPTPL
ncbi:hypothetical protein PPROV_000013700 [Pycnococcus provasolii]|uniref:Uncharacterized protein n=1 Tax=Pycnococcus provasolii TaxID=41880 RepID=A0A830H6P7_9CHLO|nr:hypothetical protein PPROV_000013700 [Pycnococcus provasolii]